MVAIGDKVKMDSERQRYTVQANSERFAILTKPFNAQRTYLYSIVDRKRGVRGPCDLIFGPPCELDSPISAAKALAMLDSGGMRVSHRRCISLTEAEAAQLSTERTRP